MNVNGLVKELLDSAPTKGLINETRDCCCTSNTFDFCTSLQYCCQIVEKAQHPNYFTGV
jgi:hypothetical protein